MSINYPEQFVSDTISTLVRGLLANSYIISEEVLKNISPSVTSNFISSYCSDNNNKGLEIPFLTTFPQTPNKNTFILTQYKGGNEDTDVASLGNILGGVSDASAGAVTHEKLLVQTDNNNNAWVTTKYNISGVTNIVQTNNYSYSDNKLSLTYIPPYSLGKSYIDVYYSPIMNDSKVGKSYIPYGTTTSDTIAIDIISSNMDTLKCLFGIFQYIHIYLKNSLENNSNLYLPVINLHGNDLIQEVTSPTNSAFSQQLYYRRIEITYYSDSTSQADATEKLDGINIMRIGDDNKNG